ncbi:Jasmonate O-methyltransferase [Senna tora]|uniref:Jasmonate O-methyltransferase n=1 Tax=Senna tora TaxID=362788 RepID=A0A834WR87_9FABA|nr:Jasmonate O-methyltransferase [Senna tora]
MLRPSSSQKNEHHSSSSYYLFRPCSKKPQEIFSELLTEIRECLEDGIEVIGGEIIEEHPRSAMPKLFGVLLR